MGILLRKFQGKSRAQETVSSHQVRELETKENKKGNRKICTQKKLGGEGGRQTKTKQKTVITGRVIRENDFI